MLHERYIEELREACGNNCNPTDVKKHPEYYLYDDVRKIVSSSTVGAMNWNGFRTLFAIDRSRNALMTL